MSIDTDKIYSPIFGTNGSDTLTGTARSEVISGRKSDDSLFGQSGSDVVFGGAGDDTIQGDSGNDTLFGGGGPSYVDMGNFVIAEDYEGRITFLDEGAGYRNSLGMYKVADDGSVYDVEILFPNASKAGSGGDLIGGESYVDVALNAGDQLGFFIVIPGLACPPRSWSAARGQADEIQRKPTFGRGLPESRVFLLWLSSALHARV